MNLGLSLVAAIKPRDELETMLAVQMAGVHEALVEQTRRMNLADFLPQLDSAERCVNRLARTFATQMEALRKHRNGGTQKVIVQHINVEDGAQAVIGHVEQTTTRVEGGDMENIIYHIPRAFCGARTRTGCSCKQPAMQNGRCRLHGGKSLSGKAHGRYKHGRFTKAAKEERRRLAALLREVKETMKLCDTEQRISDEIDKCRTLKGHHTLSKFILASKESIL